MTKLEALHTLQHYQNWRRDNDNNYAMPSPVEIAKALDVAIQVLGNIHDKTEISK